jgi:hypothetical protein
MTALLSTGLLAQVAAGSLAGMTAGQYGRLSGVGGAAAAASLAVLTVSSVGLVGMGLQGVGLGLSGLGASSSLATQLFMAGTSTAGWSSLGMAWLMGDSITSPRQTSVWVDKAGNIRWPPNDGFLGKPERVTLQPGTLIDRYGYESGRFVSPQGVPIQMRSLAPGTENKPYNIYEVIKPIEGLRGTTNPWFDQVGGGIQYKLDMTIQELLAGGFIRRTGP